MLILNTEQLRAIEAHGETGFPEEVCGFLIGTSEGETKTVTSLREIENSWEDNGAPEFAAAGDAFAAASRRRRFKIPPDEYLAADRAARAEGTAILGFYHSHPDHPARPSEHDLALAREIFPGYSYIIVSIRSGRAAEMTSWVLRDDYSVFDAEEMATNA
jgi:proteasome lid subunit RPN8/RPN11